MTWGDVGEWLIGGTGPWWAAILTFYLGQRFSSKSAQEAREFDGQDRQKERDQAFKVLEAQQKADAARAAADHAAATKLEAERRKVAEESARRERRAATAQRASQASATMRAEIAAKFKSTGLIDPAVVHEFMQASEELRYDLDRDVVATIQDAVRQFVTLPYTGPNPLAAVSRIDEALAGFSEKLAYHRFHFVDLPPPGV